LKKQEKKWPRVVGKIAFVLFFATLGFLGAYFSLEYIGEIRLLDIVATILIVGVSIFLHIILHEIGHVLGGLVSGYQFIMFRLFSTVWIKTPDGLSKRKEHIPGVLGQALMVPPEMSGQEQPPFLLYHSSGLLMNLVTATFFVFLGLMIPVGTVDYFLYVSAVVALFIIITNALPLQGTDGYNIVQQVKDPKAHEEITKTLYLYRDMVEGASLESLQQYVDLEAIDSLKDPNAATMYTVRADYFLEQKKFAKAHQIYKLLWNNIHDLFPAHQQTITMSYLFTLLLTDPNHRNVQKITQGKIYKDYQEIKQSDYIRVYAAKALYVDEDFKQAEALLNEGEEYIPLTATVTEENLERELYQYLRSEIQRIESQD